MHHCGAFSESIFLDLDQHILLLLQTSFVFPCLLVAQIPSLDNQLLKCKRQNNGKRCNVKEIKLHVK